MPPTPLDAAGTAWSQGEVQHQWLFLALSAGCCGYALWRGGAPERWAAALFVGGMILSALVVRVATQRFGSTEIGLVAADGAELAALTVLALRANRYWTIWMAAMQAVPLLVHAGIAISPAFLRPAYYTAAVIWYWPMMVVLAIGTARHRRRLLRHGIDRSWSTSSASWTAAARSAWPSG